MSENQFKPGTTPPFPVPPLDTTGRPIWEVQAPVAMIDDDDDGEVGGPFYPVFIFISAMVLGCFLIAGIWAAFTIFAPVIGP